MTDFPAFMKSAQNRVGTAQQNTKDIEGYYYEGADGSQMAFWTCHADRMSARHVHDFDEYIVVVAGQYTLMTDEEETVLLPGDPQRDGAVGKLHGGDAYNSCVRRQTDIGGLTEEEPWIRSYYTASRQCWSLCRS